MKATLPVAVLAAIVLSGCLIVPGPHGPELLVPPLPGIVWLESEPYYVQGGYTYFYRDNGWY